MAVGTTRVLVVDDDQAIRDAVTTGLRCEGFDVRTRASGADIVSLYQEFRPHLAILDLRLPVGPDGMTLARQLRASSDVPVLFLTSAQGVNERLAAFDAGADDYLTKPFLMAELLARVRALLRRAGVSSPRVEVGDLVVDPSLDVVTRGGRPVALTRTELLLVSALAHRQGRMVTKNQLLVQVWGADHFDENLVEVHMSSLRRKLNALGPPLIHTIRGLGYVLRE